MAAMIPKPVDAVRRGRGVVFDDFGAELPMALAAMDRSVYENRFVATGLPAVPGAAERPRTGGRALDVGCGVGVVPIAAARAFPQTHVSGLDFDTRSIEIARAERGARRDGATPRPERGIHALRAAGP
jgi:2-polyprenyl-3-methyl-5-hydroxy-6-metoxy-1,4-benzoquinol methylase